jgi:hypothetical protein
VGVSPAVLSGKKDSVQCVNAKEGQEKKQKEKKRKGKIATYYANL